MLLEARVAVLPTACPSHCCLGRDVQVVQAGSGRVCKQEETYKGWKGASRGSRGQIGPPIWNKPWQGIIYNKFWSHLFIITVFSLLFPT